MALQLILGGSGTGNTTYLHDEVIRLSMEHPQEQYFLIVPEQDTLAMQKKILAHPANPGGGWDQTARSMQQALVAAGIAKSVQVTNVGGAGGSVGIAQFVTGAKGDGSQLMVNGFVMVGAPRTFRVSATVSF